jgi:L-asparaginase
VTGAVLGRWPQVTVLSLGGTISSAPPADGGLARPALSATDLVVAVPALERLADIEVRDVCRLPSNDMTFEIARSVAGEIRSATERGATGVVVTQGTDTIEEMAYAWDLLVPGDAPTVVTGAMRHAGLTSADGAGNLLDAVRTAASPQARRLGCLVVLNEEIHSARTVRKAHTSSLAAFRSAGVGPLGWIAEGEPQLRDRPYPRTPVELPPGAPVVRPPLVTITLDDDGWWLPAAARARGLVVAGTGGGHVPGWLSDRLVELAGRIPVVLASRTGDGEVLTGTYGGFAGSETVLVQGGLIPAGTLDPFKARVLLGLLLSAGADHARIRSTFATARTLCRGLPATEQPTIDIGG